MTDRELHELAAKAAGINAVWYAGIGMGMEVNGAGMPRLWNPINDDGDALRLAVACGISLQFSGGRYSVSRRPSWDICCLWEGKDKCAQIRRQIAEEAAMLADDKTPNSKFTGPRNGPQE